MWDRPLFKQTGKDAFLSNYWPCVAVSVLFLLLVGIDLPSTLHERVQEFMNLCLSLNLYDAAELLAPLVQVTGLVAFFSLGLAVTFLLSLLVTNPYEVGLCRFFLENSSARPAPFARVAFGFQGNYGNVVLTQFLRNLFLMLWTLLFIVPGILRSLGYFAVPFLLAENPDLPWKRTIQLSLAMTRGYKWEIFVFYLSYLGWFLLSALTLALAGIFYVYPYRYAAQAEIYRFLRQRALTEGLATPEELPGIHPPTERSFL